MTEFTPPTYLPPPPPVVSQEGQRRYDGATYAITPGYRPRLLDLTVPASDEPVPLVVWIHGGGWLDGDRRYTPPTVPADLLFGSLLDAGLAVASVDYRHSLESPFPAQLHDVKAAIRYLRLFAAEVGIDGARLGAFGESAGGHLAALAALTGPDLAGAEGVSEGDCSVRAVVDWYGPAEMISAAAGMAPMPGGMPHPYESLLRGDADLAVTASPVTHVTSSAPPFLLVHGTDDVVVPYAQSELLEARLREAGAEVTLTTVQDANHIFLGAPDVGPIVEESVAFLARHLRT